MTEPAPNVSQVVPMFLVDDLTRSTTFYIDLLGFTMKHSWIDEGKLRWCWLELGGAALMLQEFSKEAPHRNGPATKVGVGVSLNFICNDTVALYRTFQSRGIDAGRPFVGNAMWVTKVIDPDGYVLFFESPTSEPEESVLRDELH